MSLENSVDNPTPADLELVPLAEDIFLFTGDISLISDAELVDMPIIKPDSLDRLRTEVATQLGMGNVGIQALDGMNKARGLVRLAPETLSAIKAGNMVRKGADGWNVGFLGDKSGQISSTVKWLPASKASIALSGLASASTALNMLMIQMQLSSIEKIGIKTLERVQKVHLHLLESDWDQIHSNLEFHQRKAAQIIQLGELSADLFNEILAQRTPTDMPGKLKTQTNKMLTLGDQFKGKISLQSRYEWLNENVVEVLYSAQAALEAYDSLKIYGHIKILNELQKDPSKSPDSLPSRTIELYFQELEFMELNFKNSVVPVIDEFLRISRLLIHAQGKGKKYKIPLKGKKREFRTAQEIENIASQIFNYLRSLYPSIARENQVQSDDIKLWIMNEDDYRAKLDMYALLLTADEQLIGVADIAITDRFDKRILITEKRIFIVEESQFSKTGSPILEIDRDRLGYSQYMSKVNSKGIQKFTICLKNDFEKLDFSIRPGSQAEKIDFPDWLNSFASPSIYRLDDQKELLTS